MSIIQYQEDQANRIFEQLFGDNVSNFRYLLADEVGLGKTVTAARVIAKLAENHVGKIINIGYICGNKALAIQNIKKLRERILECNNTIEIDDKSADNLSLGFLTLNDQSASNGKTRVVIHVVTPSTTIRVLSTGTVKERAYAYYLITGNKDDSDIDSFLWEACKGKRASTESFRKELEKIQDNSVNKEFIKAFKQLLDEEWNKEKEKWVKECIEDCLKTFYFKDEYYKKIAFFVLKNASDYGIDYN